MQINLRKIGGSTAVVIAPALLQQLNIRAGDKVEAQVVDGVLQLRPVRPRYTLAQLLEQTDFQAAPRNDAWLDGVPTGGELL